MAGGGEVLHGIAAAVGTWLRFVSCVVLFLSTVFFLFLCSSCLFLVSTFFCLLDGVTIHALGCWRGCLWSSQPQSYSGAKVSFYTFFYNEKRRDEHISFVISKVGTNRGIGTNPSAALRFADGVHGDGDGLERMGQKEGHYKLSTVGIAEKAGRPTYHTVITYQNEKATSARVESCNQTRDLADSPHGRSAHIRQSSLFSSPKQSRKYMYHI